MKVRKLKKQKELLEEELCDLHCFFTTTEMYWLKRNEIEFKIASIEDEIDIELKLRPFKVLLITFIIIAIILSILTILE